MLKRFRKEKGNENSISVNKKKLMSAYQKSIQTQRQQLQDVYSNPVRLYGGSAQGSSHGLWQTTYDEASVNNWPSQDAAGFVMEVFVGVEYVIVATDVQFAGCGMCISAKPSYKFRLPSGEEDTAEAIIAPWALRLDPKTLNTSEMSYLLMLKRHPGAGANKVDFLSLRARGILDEHGKVTDDGKKLLDTMEAPPIVPDPKIQPDIKGEEIPEWLRDKRGNYPKWDQWNQTVSTWHTTMSNSTSGNWEVK